MFFQINVTPKEKKISEPKIRSQENNYNLLLAPFQPPTRIRLDAKINTQVQCSLTVKNSNNRVLEVSFTKVPPPERNISLSCTECSIEPNSEVVIDILWEPREGGTWRDVLQLSDSRRIKYDVPLILTCTDLTKKATKRSAQSKQNSMIRSKTIVKKPTSQKSVLSSSNNHKTSRVESKPFERKGTITVGLANKENISNGSGFNWMFNKPNENEKRKQENKAPQSDFSKILDSSDFQFTMPSIESRLGDFQTNILQETTAFDEVQTNLRKETYVTVPKFLNIEEIKKKESQENDEYDDSLSPKPTAEFKEPLNKKTSDQAKSEFSMLLNDIKFTPLKSPVQKDQNIVFSPSHCSTVQKPPKNQLQDDGIVNCTIGHDATFEIDLPNKSVENNTFQINKSPMKNKNKVRLKPTNLANTFDKSDDIGISSLLPTSNYHSVNNDHSKLGNQFSKAQEDMGSAQDCVEADLWVKSGNDSSSSFRKHSINSTLESIPEEECDSDKKNLCDQSFPPSSFSNQFKKPKAMCLVISPPVKNSSARKPILRKVSPTKYSKVMKDSRPTNDAVNAKKIVQINNSIKTAGQVPGIPGVSISKLSLASLIKKSKNQSMVKTSKKTREVSVKLHDPNDFMAMFYNPDPFAATMTHDPFLANSLYYDEKWIFIQELEFKKWLNALLTPPEHLSTDIESAPIDVGKVWQSIRTKQDIALAETKESISARYHTNTRLNSLRKAACLMFRKQEVITVLSQITICIEKEQLLIRSDRDLHRDIGLQKCVLELFLSYNPLWLRIGLEAIYGETIPLHSNNDYVGLTKFLLNRFFSDPFIVKTHSSHLHPNIRLKTFPTLMNKFMLKKFLFLVYFLDYAKRNKLIGHDPCLFHKKATIKDSRSILLAFSRELLSGIGDLTKVLRLHGYTVSYKQAYLDEYDYAVSDLSCDLRDGVKLCRVMELIIAGKRNLVERCRVPAISRLQKIHNVNVALTTLKDEGYTIKGDIDAKSIADGHREKTLSLLWQIIYKFQAPRFEKAAKTLQRWWRSKLWYVAIRNMLRNRKNNAASVIQRAWKCYISRRKLQQLKQEYAHLMMVKNEAAKMIQLHWRRKKEAERQRQKYLYIKVSAIKVQRWWRRVHTTRPFVQKLHKTKQHVVNVQRRWRATRLMKLCRNNYIELKHKVIKIQVFWRAYSQGKKDRLIYKNQRSALISLQRRWRATLKMKEERKIYKQKLESIKLIQNWWKRYIIYKNDRDYYLSLKNSVRTIEKHWLQKTHVIEARQRFILQRQSACIIQRSWRKYRETKEDVALLKLKKNSCLKVQTWWRSVNTMRKYKKIRSSCIIIQNWWRSIILKRIERSNFLALKQSAIVIQKNWRMKLARLNYNQKKAAVLKIEAWYSNMVISRKVRQDYLKMLTAAKKIKVWFSAAKLAKIVKAKYARTKKAAIVLQRRWRARQLMIKSRKEYLNLKNSAVKIQSWWRMIQERKRYKELVRRRNASVVLQRRWRALKTGRSQRQNYLNCRSSVVLVQRKWRATLQARVERNKFLKYRSSAIVVQKNWRSILATRRFKEIKNAVRLVERVRCHQLNGRKIRNEFLLLKENAIKVQRLWKSKQQARLFQCQRRSAITIQKYWRCYVLRKEYLRKKQAATIIQRWRRHNLCGRKIRSEFVYYRECIIWLQRKWRTKLQRKEFLKKRESAIIIQKHWRCYAATKKYDELKRAVLLVQRKRRHFVAGREIREKFLNLRKRTIQIQSLWRMKRQLREYSAKRNASIVIQKNWKKFIAVKKFKSKKNAVLLIENWRANILHGRKVREEYVNTRKCIIAMQRLVRVKQQVQKYKRQRAAVITIQRFWRSIIKMRECKKEYEKIRNATIVIQRRYRAWCIGENVRHEYYSTLTVIVKIQRRWRKILHKRRVKMMEKKIKWAVRVIEDWWAYKLKELNEYRTMFAAATKIQAVWRGFKVRRAASKKLMILRERAKKATEAAVPSATLASRLQENIEIFKYATSIGQLSVCLSSLDVITRLSPNACINVCQLNLVDKLYDILTQANRSLPWLDICLKDISILLTLAKFKVTTIYVLKIEHIEVLARLLTISVDKKEDLFLNTATLIWVLTENQDYLNAMKSCSHTKYLLSSLYSSINKKVAKSSLNVSKSKNDSLPSPKPDWGLKYKRPRTFSTTLQAINAIAMRLNFLNFFPVAEAQKSFSFSM